MHVYVRLRLPTLRWLSWYTWEWFQPPARTPQVVDTGIFTEHLEFGRGARAGTPVDVREGPGYDPSGAGGDCPGHGTLVAGAAAGANVGVARNATVHAVVAAGCGGRGRASDTIAALEWVSGAPASSRPPAKLGIAPTGGTPGSSNNVSSTKGIYDQVPVRQLDADDPPLPLAPPLPRRDPRD